MSNTTHSLKTLVLGASPNPERYANRAVRSLRRHGHDVVAVGLREDHIDDTPILAGTPQADAIDTVTLYLGPERQKAYYDYILGLKPRRIVFNPGTENPELAHLATQNGIEPVVGCTLVMLSIGNY